MGITKRFTGSAYAAEKRGVTESFSGERVTIRSLCRPSNIPLACAGKHWTLGNAASKDHRTLSDAASQQEAGQ